MKKRAFAAIAMLLCLTACGEQSAGPSAAGQTPKTSSAQVRLITRNPAILVTMEPDCTIAPAEPKWTKEELNAIALTLAGECYEDKEHDKRLVCEVILNRVSDGRFGDSICEVLSAENQFAGYWCQSRPISENDYAVAEQALEDWYANDCEALSEYLFFCAGENRENSFY